MSLLNKIISRDMCTGCGLCASVFESKIGFDYGGDFNRPYSILDLNKTEIVLLKSICPGLHQAAPSNVSGGKIDLVWGQYFSSFVGASADPNIRYKASSGGVISQVLIYLLECGYVDTVLQIKPSKGNPIESEVVLSHTAKDVMAASGSRYSPASPLISIKQLVNSNPNIKIAFVGKPCDVNALRNIEKYDHSIKKAIKYKLSFFCAGTPSRSGISSLLDKLEVRKDEVTEFSFRGNGWPGNVIAKTGSRIAETDYSSSWGSILGPTIQSRCKLCADGTGESADIVSADVWHADANGYPLFSESDGQGLAMSRTESGDQLLKEMIDSGLLILDDYDLSHLKKVQPAQFHRKTTVLSRKIAKLFVQGVAPKYTNLRLIGAAKLIGFRINLRSFLGSVLRAFRNDI